MEQLSELVYTDKLNLVFKLYKLYLEITNAKESFDLFYPFSEIILSDFDEKRRLSKSLTGDILHVKCAQIVIQEGCIETLFSVRGNWGTSLPDCATQETRSGQRSDAKQLT